MKNSRLFIVLAMLCFVLKGYAQTGTIQGKVSIGPPDSPLPGATVRIKNSSSITSTDNDGRFTLTTALKEGILQISYTGYRTAEISFKNPGPEINIILKEEKGELEEVVVIGYGETTKKLNTGSVASISAKQIADQPVTNVLSALSGRMPGVFVQTSNGLPGGNINIQIRGKGSITSGTSPLYVIDGIPFDNSPANQSGTIMVQNSIAGTFSPISTINPADIESVSILKDADATAIYGSRGANGVVMITTKKGASGNTSIDINVLSGVNTVSQKPSLLTFEQYLLMRREAYANDGLIPTADPLSPNYAPDLTVWSQNVEQNWVDGIFGKTAGFSEVQARVSGGKGTTTFSANVSHHREGTVLAGENKFQRSSLHLQINHQSEDGRLRFAASSQIGMQDNDMANPTAGINSSFLLAPNYPLYLADGSYNWFLGNFDAMLNARNRSRVDNTVTSLTLQYQAAKGLSLKLSGGYSGNTNEQTLIFPSSSLRPGAANYTDFGKSNSFSYITEPQAEYQLYSGRSKFTLLAGGTLQYRKSKNQVIQAGNYRVESLMEDLASAGTIDSRYSIDLPYRFASVFARGTYSFSGTYLLNATFRRDGSSRFGPGNRYGNFGSIGAAWIFSELKYIKTLLPFLSHGKLRASYGSTGNDQIQDYQFASTYSSPGTALYQDQAIIRPSRISNTDFKWETTKKFDIALELGFFSDRVFLSADYYLNRSADQLVNYTLPQMTGFSSYQANLPAVVRNSGLELALEAKLISKKGFRWNSSFNLTVPRNKLESFENFATSSYAAQYELGFDITRIRGYRYLGPDPKTGKAVYADQNGNPSSTPYQNHTLGKTTPDFFGGLSNSFAIGNLSLDILAQFVSQQGTGSLLYTPGNFTYNNFAIAADRWREPGGAGSFPKATTVFDFNLTGSSANIFDTSYLRIKNIALSYQLPERVLKSIGIKTLSVYGQVQNAITFWNKEIPLLDPETGGSSSAATRNFPTLRTFVIGLQIKL